MTKNDLDFDTWFDTLQICLLDEVGIDFKDRDSVRDDYKSGRNVHEVVSEIAQEYKS